MADDDASETAPTPVEAAADHVDVAVIGAGLSGLVAARELHRAGLDVVVLEAADRCGGRALTETSALGSRLDLGGQWIGHDHHRLQALVDELGATRFTMHTSPAPTLVDGGQRLRVISPRVLLAACYLVVLAALTRTNGKDRWRSTSVAEWLAKVPVRSRRLLEVAAAVSWTADMERISVRTMVSLISAQGGLVNMLSTKGGAQDALIVEGVGFLVDQLVDELGDAVQTSVVVQRIDRDDSGVTVRSADGELRARRAIIAVPPPNAARIEHRPPLPRARADLERSTFMGSVFKAVAVYPEPFWRGVASGELVFLDRPGFAVFDTSAPGGPGHLCFLVGGTDAESLDELTTDERRDLLLSRVAAHLGPAVLEPSSWHEKAWHKDHHAGGGYIALPSLDAAVATVPMASDPIGAVHFAGSETALDHPGYFDGAIEAGHRAAREVAAGLG